MVIDVEMKVRNMVADGANSECMAVKRDPHDRKLISLAIEDMVKVIDLRKLTNRGGDIAFTAHID